MKTASVIFLTLASMLIIACAFYILHAGLLTDSYALVFVFLTIILLSNVIVDVIVILRQK